MRSSKRKSSHSAIYILCYQRSNRYQHISLIESFQKRYRFYDLCSQFVMLIQEQVYLFPRTLSSDHKCPAICISKAAPFFVRIMPFHPNLQQSALDNIPVVLRPLTSNEEMNKRTTAEFNPYLENIAKLIEATAKDTEAAAKIVRDSKAKA